MTAFRPLHRSFSEAASRYPYRTAVVEPDRGALTYEQLAALSNRLRDRLCAHGVRPGDRVGIYLRKSIDSVAAILGVLKTGAAYVPVDPDAPPARNAYIMHNCAVRAIVMEARFEDKLLTELAGQGTPPRLLLLDGTGAGEPLARALDQEDEQGAPAISVDAESGLEDLAYILYTSGSTGKPKGVMLTHENAVSFVDWCSEVFDPRPEDRFSSHAPFHFDLSILDIHVAFKHGAALVLVPEERAARTLCTWRGSSPSKASRSGTLRRPF